MKFAALLIALAVAIVTASALVPGGPPRFVVTAEAME